MNEGPVLPKGQETFKLSEVCKLANVQPYMLRFWGTEFPKLEAAKSGTGQRHYSREQAELILEIRHLLFEEGLTIAGARKRIEAQGGKPSKVRTSSAARGKKGKKGKAADTQVSEEAKELDKKASENVKTLLATLSEVRGELVSLVAEMQENDSVGT